MTHQPQWPDFSLKSAMYESFYMRAASPDQEAAVWLRHTVQKSPGKPPKASIWLTLFEPARGRPVARKLTVGQDGLAVPDGGWISIGGSRFGPDLIEGRFGDARWSLRMREADSALRHLSRDWLYRSPLPKTKPESPIPFALFEGEIECDGRIHKLDGWPGMVGHNWGAEHAWTWVWLSGAGFTEDSGAWIDMVLGRVKIAGRTTPWVANGAVSIGGERHRLGGMLKRGVTVDAAPGRAQMVLPGAAGVTAGVTVEAPKDSTVCWQYGSPDGHVHEVLNCSMARLELEVAKPGIPNRKLSTSNGGTYELGLPGSQDWVTPEPLPDEW